MTARVSIGIQSHPHRSEMAAALLRCLGGQGEIVVDPDPDNGRSAWRTYRHALELTIKSCVSREIGPTHRLVLQDDVLVCEKFVEAVHSAASARPGRVLVFFVAGQPYEHNRAVRTAASKGDSWAELDNQRWCPAVATCWPVELIEPLLAFVDAQAWPAAFTADDEIIGRFFRHSGHLPLATVPSLVEHPDTVPSIANSRRSYDGRDWGRRAVFWIGDTGSCDPSGIDWTVGPGDGPLTPA